MSMTTAEPGADGAVLRMLEMKGSRMIKQGAEAKVYCVDMWTNASTLTLPNENVSVDTQDRTEQVLIKHRFFKRYRHPALSSSVTASRTVWEARAIVRCARHGVHVPRLVCVDETRGILGMAWIDGPSVRQWLGGVPEEGETQTAEQPEAVQKRVMDKIGIQIAQMHCADVIHGDLTTSNMMLPGSVDDPEVILIDFGLASVSSFWEDKAVDLYVLERAFASTHPTSEHLFQRVLDAYAKHTTDLTRGTTTKGECKRDGAWPLIYARLQEVRLRGRKRSMVG